MDTKMAGTGMGSAGTAWRQLAWVLLCLACLSQAVAAPADAPVTVRDVEWQKADGSWQPAALPDEFFASPAVRRYRWVLRLDAPARQQAIYFPGLMARSRIVLNGELLHDGLDPATPRPRAPDVPLLLQVRDGALRVGDNLLELEAQGSAGVSVSTLRIGPQGTLRGEHRAKLAGTVVGPMAAGAVIGTLGLIMLALWLRRREAIVGYFGLAALGWGLHNVWSIWPTQLLPQPFYTIGWNLLLSFWISMAVAFCLRYADWLLPRVEALLWAVAPLGLPVLYAAAAAGALPIVSVAWRLGLLVIVGGGVAAMIYGIWRRRDLDSMLIAVTALLSLACGVHDWRGEPGDNNPVTWVPYAGLAFVVVVARLLIDRFVSAQRSLEQLNAELEQRVAAQNAELHDALDEMRHARDAAEAAAQAKTRFLAAASHDLRQPAHALGLYLATLRQQPLAPEPAELAERMGRSLEALDSLFNSLLDVSRIDAGAVVPHPVDTPLAALVRRLADEAAPQAEARGLRLALHLGRGAEEARARTDLLLLERILRNLLTNALRYTQRGGVLLALRRRGPQWRIEVWDSGVGIADAHRERVFEEFFQVDNAARDRRAGLGLGLAIVRRLAALLGLPLTLHSRPGRGSVFLLSLPACVDCVRPAAPAEAPPAPSLAGLRVGVVEDDAEVRDALTRLLQGWGCSVQVSGGADAEFEPATQALLVDYRLPGARSGVDVVREQRARLGASLPVLVVTGESDPVVLRELAAAGLAWLAKPVPAERLRDWLGSVAQGVTTGAAA